MALNPAVTDAQWTPNVTPDRGADITEIIIHHWGAPGQHHQNVVNYLCSTDREDRTSAHYVVSANRTTQIAHDYDMAWHCRHHNRNSIGIECRPECAPDDFLAVARLIAAIRAEWGWLPLKGHQDYNATACPGLWEPRLTELSDAADAINAGQTPTIPDAPTGGDIEALQRAVGAVPDGVVGPDTRARILAVASASAWGGRRFPFGVEYTQSVVGTTVDGEWGPASDAAHDETVAAVQRAVGADVDGIWGPWTNNLVNATLAAAEQA